MISSPPSRPTASPRGSRCTQIIRAKDLHSNCDYTLLEGRTLRGKVEKVLMRGELIVDGPDWHGREGMGRFVPRGEVRAF